MYPDPDDEALRPILTGVHRVLGHLAGRLPDDILAALREQLANADLLYLAETITIEIATRELPLLADDAAAIAGMHQALTGEPAPALLDRVPVVTSMPGLPHHFAPTGGDGTPVPGGPVPGGPDYEAIGAAYSIPGVMALWRAYRTPETPGPPVRVYVVEVAPDQYPWMVTGEVQRAVAGTGSRPPRVEVYATGDELAPYLQAARDGGQLLWSATETPAPSPHAHATAGQGRVNQAIAAARAGREDELRDLIDWGLTGAPHVARTLGEYGPTGRREAAGALDLLLPPPHQTVDPTVVMGPLHQLMAVLRDAEEIRFPVEEERREWVRQLQVPEIPTEGLPPERIAQLTSLRDRASAIDEVYLVASQGSVLPLAFAPDSGLLVAVFG